jgi:hypothetical protein
MDGQLLVAILASGAFGLLGVLAVCWTVFRATEVKYGSERRISEVEVRMQELERQLAGINPERLVEIRSDLNNLKLKVGLR